jgi:hypothetical protein
MPLVFAQNEATESGHRYADELGVAYEYPSRYRNWIEPGVPFIYYRGRKRVGGGVQPQVYFGAGVVGAISPSREPGRFICAVESFRPFLPPVSFKLGDEYLEPIGPVPAAKAGLYYRQGVRRIDEGTYAKILAVAQAADPLSNTRDAWAALPYASPERAQRVDEIAMELALAHVRSSYPGRRVERMPHNNPGYDIRIEGDGAVEYVEVKGTMRPLPHFYMSEGERLFGGRHAEHYSLLVVYGIDLGARTGTIVVRPGSLEGQDLSLRPVQWEGELRSPTPDSS